MRKSTGDDEQESQACEHMHERPLQLGRLQLSSEQQGERSVSKVKLAQAGCPRGLPPCSCAAGGLHEEEQGALAGLAGRSVR